MKAQGPNRLIAELTRRGVIKVVGSYLVLLWLLAQGFADLFPAFGFPPWSVRAFVFAGIGLTPVVFFLAWRYDLTARGIVRDVKDQPQETPPSEPARNREREREHKAEVGFIEAAWTEEHGDGTNAQFFSELVVGRDAGVDIRLNDRLVSRRHAIIFPERGSWYINDLGSSNGTFVNGERVTKARLPTHSTVRFHEEGPSITLKIRFLEETLSTPAANSSIRPS